MAAQLTFDSRVLCLTSADDRRIELTMPLSPSINAYWTIVSKPFPRMITTKEGKLYKAAVATFFHRLSPLIGDVAVTVKVYRKERRGDLDNFLKVALDALSKLAYADDKQIKEISATLHDDKFAPRVEVVIETTESLLPFEPK